jgi:CheY-like chemotaxis protein
VVAFTLPIPDLAKSVQLASIQRTAMPVKDRRQPLVLVLHDDSRVLSLLRRHIAGCEFRLSQTLQDARDVARRLLPSAVLVDAGWSALRAVTVTELGLPPQTSVITCPLPSMRRLGVLLGAADFLTKPVTQQDLQAALDRLGRRPHTVLIVDDNPNIVRLLARMVRMCCPETQVLKAFGGAEALELVQSSHPDLVLLDLVMPGVTGYDVLAALDRETGRAPVDIVIISVHRVEDEASLLEGSLRLEREAGFSLTDLLQFLQITLPQIVTLAAADPGGSAAPEGNLSGLRVS